MKDVIVLILVPVTTTDAPSDGIRSRSSTRAYDEGWERVFGKRQEKPQRPQDMN